MREYFFRFWCSQFAIDRSALSAVPRRPSGAFVPTQTTDRSHLKHRLAERFFNSLRGIVAVRTNRLKDTVVFCCIALQLAEHRENLGRIQRVRGGVTCLVICPVRMIFTSPEIDLIPLDAECFLDSRTLVEQEFQNRVKFFINE